MGRASRCAGPHGAWTLRCRWASEVLWPTPFLATPSSSLRVKILGALFSSSWNFGTQADRPTHARTRVAPDTSQSVG